jgi:hypothetical protein
VLWLIARVRPEVHAEPLAQEGGRQGEGSLYPRRRDIARRPNASCEEFSCTPSRPLKFTEQPILPHVCQDFRGASLFSLGHFHDLLVESICFFLGYVSARRQCGLSKKLYSDASSNYDLLCYTSHKLFMIIFKMIRLQTWGRIFLTFFFLFIRMLLLFFFFYIYLDVAMCFYRSKISV